MQATPNLIVAAPGDVVKNIIRIAAYWLCATLLLWIHPFAEWRFSTVGYFLASSSLAITALSYASSVLRGCCSNTAANHHPTLLTSTLSHAGLIAFEILVVTSVVMATERWLF